MGRVHQFLSLPTAALLAESPVAEWIDPLAFGLMAGSRSPPTQPVLPTTVQIPLADLQAIGILLVVAIVCLVGITLSIRGKKNKQTRP